MDPWELGQEHRGLQNYVINDNYVTNDNYVINGSDVINLGSTLGQPPRGQR